MNQVEGCSEKRRVRNGLPPPSSEAASRRMAATGQRDTPAEMEIRKRLFARGLRYRVHYPVLAGSRRRGDIVFPRLGVVIFVDGCFWHGCPLHGTWPKVNADFWREKIEANRARDADTNRRLQENGWLVMRVWEHELPDEVVERIIRSLEERGRSPRGSIERGVGSRHVDTTG